MACPSTLTTTMVQQVASPPSASQSVGPHAMPTEPNGWLGFGPEPTPEPAASSPEQSLTSSTSSSSASDSEQPSVDEPQTEQPAAVSTTGIPSAYSGFTDDSLMALMGLPTRFGTTNPALAELQAAPAQPKRKTRRGKRQPKPSNPSTSPTSEHQDQECTAAAPRGYDPVPIPPEGLPANLTLKVATLHMPQWQLPNTQRRLEGEPIRSKRSASQADLDVNTRPRKRCPTPEEDIGELNYFPDEGAGREDLPEADVEKERESGHAAGDVDEDEEFWMGIPKWVRPHVLIRKEDMEEEMHKYWYARYTLFSHFDEGYALDRESWYSITPEGVANQISRRMAAVLSNGLVHGPKVEGRVPARVLDVFCGAGGNVLAFAKRFEHVVGIDIDPVKVELARHNARIAGVDDRVTIICADILEWTETYRQRRAAAASPSSAPQPPQDLLQTSSAADWDTWAQWAFDAVFMSPPWGGIDYQEIPKPVQPAQPAQAALPGQTAEPSTEADTELNHSTIANPPSAPIEQGISTGGGADTDEPAQATGTSAPEDTDAARVDAERKVAELEEALSAVAPGTETKAKRKRLRWKLNQARTCLLSLYDAALAGSGPTASDAGASAARPHEEQRATEVGFEPDSLYSLSRLAPLNGEDLVRLCTNKLGTSNVALFLPRNTGWEELAHLGSVAHEGCSPNDAALVEREVNGRKLVAVTCYLGALARQSPQQEDTG